METPFRLSSLSWFDQAEPALQARFIIKILSGMHYAADNIRFDLIHKHHKDGTFKTVCLKNAVIFLLTWGIAFNPASLKNLIASCFKG